jgi:hypothetical protein
VAGRYNDCLSQVIVLPSYLEVERRQRGSEPDSPTPLLLDNESDFEGNFDPPTSSPPTPSTARFSSAPTKQQLFRMQLGC